jgi:hypothetical protein
LVEKRLVGVPFPIEHGITTYFASRLFHMRNMAFEAVGFRDSRRRLAGRANTMAQTMMKMDPSDPVARFDAALEALEGHLGRVLADDRGQAESAELLELREQVKFLTDERDQLLADLEAERTRVRRLKAANEDVSDRLDAVVGALKDMAPAMEG